MTATSISDTNILLYAASNAAADPAKRPVARALLTRPDIGFSAQVPIVTAAQKMGCQTLYSEDLNPGQVYDGVIVVNPFL